MIGIIRVRHQRIILVGPNQAVPNQFTTHVQPVGEFLMVEALVYGQKRWIQVPNPPASRMITTTVV